MKLYSPALAVGLWAMLTAFGCTWMWPLIVTLIVTIPVAMRTSWQLHRG